MTTVKVSLRFIEVDDNRAGLFIRPLNALEFCEINIELYERLKEKQLLDERPIEVSASFNAHTVTVLKGIGVGTCLYYITDKLSAIDRKWFVFPWTITYKHKQQLKNLKSLITMYQGLYPNGKKIPYITFEETPSLVCPEDWKVFDRRN